MAVAARSWQHPRWAYDESGSEAARRSAARSSARQQVDAPRPPRAQSARTTVDRRGAPVAVREPLSAPGLRLVPRSRTRFGSTLVLTLTLAVSLLLPVALNTLLVRTQIGIAQLQRQQEDLVAQRSALRAQQASLSATQRVKETADRLGMVTPTEVEFIDLAGAASIALVTPAAQVTPEVSAPAVLGSTVPVQQDAVSAASGGDAPGR